MYSDILGISKLYTRKYYVPAGIRPYNFIRTEYNSISDDNEYIIYYSVINI